MAQLPALAACLPRDSSVSLRDFSISAQMAPKHIEALPTYVRRPFQNSLLVQEEGKEATFIRLFSQLKRFRSFHGESMRWTGSLQAFSKMGSKFCEIEKPEGLTRSVLLKS